MLELSNSYVKTSTDEPLTAEKIEQFSKDLLIKR